MTNKMYSLMSSRVNFQHISCSFTFWSFNNSSSVTPDQMKSTLVYSWHRLTGRIFLVIIFNWFDKRISKSDIVDEATSQTECDSLTSTDYESLKRRSGSKSSGSASKRTGTIKKFILVNNTLSHIFCDRKGSKGSEIAMIEFHRRIQTHVRQSHPKMHSTKST